MKWIPRRPFSNAHWTLCAGLVVPWLGLELAQQCREGGYALEAGVASATLVLAFWVADRATAGKTGWGKISGMAIAGAYNVLALILVVLLVSLPLSLFFPAPQCYTPRHGVAEAVAVTGSLRLQIAERAEKQNSLRGSGAGLAVEAKGRVGGGDISADGTLTILVADPAAIVVFRPGLANGKATWTCTGFPQKWMPAACRESPTGKQP